MRTAATILAVLLPVSLAACGDQSRSASYFENNPEEARTVLERCARGTHRGRECENAQHAAAQARYDAAAKVWEGMGRGGAPPSGAKGDVK